MFVCVMFVCRGGVPVCIARWRIVEGVVEWLERCSTCEENEFMMLSVWENDPSMRRNCKVLEKIPLAYLTLFFFTVVFTLYKGQGPLDVKAYRVRCPAYADRCWRLRFTPDWTGQCYRGYGRNLLVDVSSDSWEEGVKCSLLHTIKIRSKWGCFGAMCVAYCVLAVKVRTGKTKECSSSELSCEIAIE